MEKKGIMIEGAFKNYMEKTRNLLRARDWGDSWFWDDEEERSVHDFEELEVNNYCWRTKRSCVGGAWDGLDGKPIDCQEGMHPLECQFRCRTEDDD